MPGTDLDIKILEARCTILENNLKKSLNLMQQLVNQVSIMNESIIDMNGRLISLEREIKELKDDT